MERRGRVQSLQLLQCAERHSLIDRARVSETKAWSFAASGLMSSKAVELMLSRLIEKSSACLQSHLGLVGGIGDILFLGSSLLPIGCVCTGLVSPEVADKSGMDTNGAGDDARDVLGEHSGLVGADNRGVCYRLTRTENTNEEVLLSHPFRGESERKSDRRWEALRNSNDDQCY